MIMEMKVVAGPLNVGMAIFGEWLRSLMWVPLIKYWSTMKRLFLLWG